MVNQGTILGRVGKIDNRVAQSGIKITTLSMVTSKKIKKNGVKEEKVTWHNVTLFNKLAEIATEYVEVGDLLYVQGEMDNQKYTDANGQERTKFFIIGHDIQLMPKTRQRPASKPQVQDESFVDDDLPPW